MRRAQALASACLATLLAVPAGCSRAPSPEQRSAWGSELERLQAEQDSLRERAAGLLELDPRIQALPQDDVVIAVPTAFLRMVVERVFTDVVDNTTLRLSGIRAHIAKSVKKVVTVGEFTVDVEILEVVGKLRPREPDLRFGGDRIAMSLPIEIAQGHGDARIHFVWDGKNVAGVACGDMDITQRVQGDVIPATYVVAGTLVLRISGKHVVANLDFPETRLRIRVRPSKESWDAIHKILEEKGGVCGWVLDKVNVPKLLTGLVEEKGFNVKLPVDKIRPFLLPAGVRDSVKVGDRTIAVEAQTTLIRIDPDAIWYGASLQVDTLSIRALREPVAWAGELAPSRQGSSALGP